MTHSKVNVARSKSFNASILKMEKTLRNKQRSLFLEVPKRQESVQLLSVKSVSQPSTSTSIVALDSTINNVRSVDLDNRNRSCSLVRSYTSGQSQSQRNIPQTLLRQRKAYTLLGIILLFLNIFTWPAIVALLLTSMINTISIGRETLLPLFTTICVNSVVNPILYTATITEFRSVLCEILISIYDITKRRFRICC
jgi:hypothetical protein